MIGFADAGDLQVQLDSGNAVLRAGNLEIHVAVMILVADDVGQQDPPIGRFIDQADRDTGHGIVDLDARVHECERRTADRRHGAGAIGFQNVGDNTNRVGEHFLAGNDRFHTAFRQCPVTNLATTGTTNRTALSDRERGEIVVEHELLGVFFRQTVHTLLIFGRAEGDRHQRLRLATLEDRRPMGAGQHADVAFDRTQGLAVTAIRTSP